MNSYPPRRFAAGEISPFFAKQKMMDLELQGSRLRALENLKPSIYSLQYFWWILQKFCLPAALPLGRQNFWRDLTIFLRSNQLGGFAISFCFAK